MNVNAIVNYYLSIFEESKKTREQTKLQDNHLFENFTCYVTDKKQFKIIKNRIVIDYMHLDINENERYNLIEYDDIITLVISKDIEKITNQYSIILQENKSDL